MIGSEGKNARLIVLDFGKICKIIIRNYYSYEEAFSQIALYTYEAPQANVA